MDETESSGEIPRRLRIPALLLLVVIVVGTCVFWLEWRAYDATWMDAIYMTFITITTVGYDEIHPLDASGRLAAISVSLGGIGALFYLFTAVMETLVSRRIRDPFGRRKMQEEIDRLDDHVLVVGFGRMGRRAAGQLDDDNVPFVVVDTAEEVAQDCRELGYPHVIGNAEEDEVLETAGIARAKAVIVCTRSDADNAFIVMSARALAPEVFIVVRADDADAVRKLERAGADRAIDLYTLGGQRLAHSVVRPAALQFLTDTLRQRGTDLAIEDVVVGGDSELADRTLRDLDLRRRVGISVIAIVRQDASFPNPGPDVELEAGDQLIVMGNTEQVQALRQIAGS